MAKKKTSKKKSKQIAFDRIDPPKQLNRKDIATRLTRIAEDVEGGTAVEYLNNELNDLAADCISCSPGIHWGVKKVGTRTSHTPVVPQSMTDDQAATANLLEQVGLVLGRIKSGNTKGGEASVLRRAAQQLAGGDDRDGLNWFPRKFYNAQGISDHQLRHAEEVRRTGPKGQYRWCFEDAKDKWPELKADFPAEKWRNWEKS